jgi:O-antigen/teichoic acid export membrane protein
MGISGAVQSLSTSGCRVYVGLVFGSLNLAIFGALSYSMTAVNLVTNALGNYFLPYFSMHKENKYAFIHKLLISQFIILALAIILLLIVFFCGEFLLYTAFNKDIAEYQYGLFLLSLTASLKASTNLLGSAILSTEKYSFQLYFTIINVFMLVIFLALLESKGLEGVFLSILMATVIEWLLIVVLSIRYFNAYFKKNFD